MSLYRQKFHNKIHDPRRETDFASLRAISIVEVARVLGLELVRTGAGTYAMREDREVTSLAIFERTNTWHRFSGKESGGVSRGSTIDLVMHIRDCSLRDAALFLSSRFL